MPRAGSTGAGGASASDLIDAKIQSLGDWRGEALARFRRIILATDPGIVEEWKWMGSPVWSLDGLLVIGDPHKGKIKLTFAHGASLADPEKLFNNGLEGNARRAIDVLEGDVIEESALKALVRAAIAHNREKLKTKAAKPKA